MGRLQEERIDLAQEARIPIVVDSRNRGGSEQWVADQVEQEDNLQGCSFGPLDTQRLVEGESYWSPGSNSPDTQRVGQQAEAG